MFSALQNVIFYIQLGLMSGRCNNILIMLVAMSMYLEAYTTKNLFLGVSKKHLNGG